MSGPTTSVPYSVTKARGSDHVIEGKTGIVGKVIDKRDADFIVRACNNHEALVNALRACAEQLAHCLGPDTEAGRKASKAIADVEAGQ